MQYKLAKEFCPFCKTSLYELADDSFRTKWWTKLNGVSAFKPITKTHTNKEHFTILRLRRCRKYIPASGLWCYKCDKTFTNFKSGNKFFKKKIVYGK